MLSLVNGTSNADRKVDKSYSIAYYAEFVRLGYYVIAISISIITQYLHPYFINSKVWLPVYFVIFFALVYHLVNLLFLQDEKIKALEDLGFFIDTFFVSAIIFLTYYSYPIFTVLFLINIAMYAFLRGANKAFLLSGFTVLTYGVCYAKGFPEDSLLDALPFFLNSLMFFAVAFLSGYLGDIYSEKDIRLKKAQKDLGRLQNFSDILVQNIGTGLVTLDSSLKVSYLNNAAKKIFGSELSSGQKNDLLEKGLQYRSNGQKMTYRQELELRAQGETKYVEMISTYLPEEENQETAWILLLQDLSEIKNLEKELALKEKLAAIGQLAGGIAHEIRNPLASISGSVEMLKQSVGKLSNENEKLFNIVIREIDRLNQLITEFLSFVRPEVTKSDRCDMKAMVDEIFALLENNKELMGETKIIYELEECRLLCDKGKLKQAFINIITNALQAVKDVSDAKLNCEGKKSGRFYFLKVSDNGPGISDEIISKVFEPFYTTKTKGTGLGLAITHRIIEGHSGEIKVESKEKKGTTFFIKLPIE